MGRASGIYDLRFTIYALGAGCHVGPNNYASRLISVSLIPSEVGVRRASDSDDAPAFRVRRFSAALDFVRPRRKIDAAWRALGLRLFQPALPEFEMVKGNDNQGMPDFALGHQEGNF